MCKFNQNLFIVWCSIWFFLFKIYNASPVDFMLLDNLIEEPPNVPEHDLTYDQRQNGTENIRFRVNGVILAFPSSQSNQASSAVGNLAANYLLQLAAGTDDDDDSDYFPFVKNANNENGVTAPSDEKEATEPAKDDKNKKKVQLKPEQIKDNSVKRVVVVKEGVKDEGVELSPEHVNPVAVDEQPKLDVIPIKKVQSRRKNKHKLRLAGLLDFLERYKGQF
ncbi:uncharacterized protein LOC116340910 [Contarinia nasturtii]|uniref:uncharacterized protein LOC116340910 n=1 Tax=Contarinia nasturtii TaxID=265458 RepID=UPI0012D3BCC0|nr:uncharacterized protein LOC116340910 [Contarinia nasturtii]